MWITLSNCGEYETGAFGQKQTVNVRGFDFLRSEETFTKSISAWSGKFMFSGIHQGDTFDSN